VGRSEVVARLRKNPLARALRVDKLTLAALQGTLGIHRAGRAFDEIPVLRQLALTDGEIRVRAERFVDRLRAQSTAASAFSAQSVSSSSGGGALPEQTLPSWAISIACASPDRISKQLRLGDPAVFGRVQADRVLIDLRTVLPEEDEPLLGRILGCSLVDAG
jgi:L-seryl-tRNA(Ser) seleniumtransferase